MWPRWAWIVVCVLLGQTLNQKDPRSSHTLHPRHAHSPIAKVTFPTTSLHPGALQLPGPYLWEKKKSTSGGNFQPSVCTGFKTDSKSQLSLSTDKEVLLFHIQYQRKTP